MSIKPPPLEVLTLEQAADLLRLSKDTVVKLTKAGKIGGQKAGHQWRFLRSELERYLRGSRSAKAS